MFSRYKRNFVYTSTPEDDLTCSICSDAYSEPLDTKCGHTFCKDCLSTWMKRKKCCPLDNIHVSKKNLKITDSTVQDRLDELEIACVHCSATMPRGSFLQHVNSDCISSMPNSGEMTTSSDFTMSSQAMNAGFGCEYKYYSTTLDSLPVSFSELDLTSSGVIPGIDLPLLVSRGVLQSNEDSSEGAFADFALVFTGALEITTAGLYNFYTASNDGSKLYLNDELIVDNDGKHYVVEKQGNIELCTGFHAFRLEYFHTCGKLLEGIREGAYLSFQYSFKGTSWYGTDAIRKQEIPLTRLRLPRLIDINEDLSKSKTSRSRATSSAMSGLSSSEKMPALDMATLDAEEKWRHYEGVIEKLTIERDEYAKRVTELKDAKARMKEQHKKDLTDIRATHLADTEYLKQHLFISMVASHKQNIAATNATVGALPAGANVSAQDLFELAEKYGVSANKWERFILDALHKGTAQCERDLQDDEQILTFTDGFTKSAKITGSSTSQSLEPFGKYTTPKRKEKVGNTA